MYDARISYRYMNEYIYIFIQITMLLLSLLLYIYDAYRTDSGMITVECSIIFHTL